MILNEIGIQSWEKSKENNSKSIRTEALKEVNPFYKYTSRKMKHKYTDGPLSYSNIATQLSEEKSVPPRGKLPF